MNFFALVVTIAIQIDRHKDQFLKNYFHVFKDPQNEHENIKSKIRKT